MRFAITPDVFTQFPSFCVGVVVVRNADNTGSNEELRRLLEGRIEEACAGAAQLVLSDAPHPSIAVWREVFSQLGWKSRVLSSIEALLQRVAKGSGLPSINKAVDLSNAAALRHVLPMGCHDLSRMSGDLRVRPSRTGERFTPMGTDDSEEVPVGELVYADEAEVRTRRWVWRQGENAKVTEASTAIFFPIDGFVGVNDAAVRAASAEVASLAAQYLGGTVETFFLDRNRPEAEILSIETGRAPGDDVINSLLTRGISAIIPRELLERRLRRGDKLRIYFGVDPTSPVIHLGHTVCLRKLRAFQDAGHQVVLLIGDFTGRVGDPTDRSATRVQLTHEQVLENARTYQEQAAKVLDFQSPTNPVVVRFNSEWLDRLTFKEVLELAAVFTVQQMAERDMYQRRLAENKPIGLHEFLYPLMQGYDSVALEIDGEIGGTDQTFNMLAGRTLLQVLKGKEKFVITMPLLEGTDGRKMSKSFGNVIGVTDPPAEMYGRVMSLKDELILKYFELSTNVPDSEIATMRADLVAGVNPMLLKKRLARQIVTEFHSAEAATAAERDFERVVQAREVPEEIPEVRLSDVQDLTITDLVLVCDLSPSRAAARRLVEQGGVEVDGRRITDPRAPAQVRNGSIVRGGKRRYARISITAERSV